LCIAWKFKGSQATLSHFDSVKAVKATLLCTSLGSLTGQGAAADCPSLEPGRRRKTANLLGVYGSTIETRLSLIFNTVKNIFYFSQSKKGDE
jgi:hypothetical protein